MDTTRNLDVVDRKIASHYCQQTRQSNAVVDSTDSFDSSNGHNQKRGCCRSENRTSLRTLRFNNYDGNGNVGSLGRAGLLPPKLRLRILRARTWTTDESWLLLCHSNEGNKKLSLEGLFQMKTVRNY